MASADRNNEEVSEQTETESMVERTEEVEVAHRPSPDCKRKLWMRTPFSSFSSDSTVGPKDSGSYIDAHHFIRCQLQKPDPANNSNLSGQFSFSSYKKQGCFRSLCDNEASIRANNRRKTLQGPLRVLRLCVLSIVFPGLLVGVPLYMRFFVYGEQAYPIGMSDMRLLDHKVSSVWCQSQTIWSNATFNAYLMDGTPKIEKQYDHISMTRELHNLEDDMKEYWGFYLLKGSVITVSACARFPGSSLILIRGHKNLRDCAFIGDDSSEEVEELYPEDTNSTESKDDEPANNPGKMTKMSDGVVVLGKNKTSNLNQNDLLHRHLIDEGSISNSMSKGQPHKVLKSDIKEGSKIHLAYAEFGNKLAKQYIETEKRKMNKTEANLKNKRNNKYRPLTTTNIPSTSQTSHIDITGGQNATSYDMRTANYNQYLQSTPLTSQSSKEIYEDLKRKLEGLGDKGKRILKRLHEKNESNKEIHNNESTDSPEKFPSTVKSQNSLHKIRYMKQNLTNDSPDLGDKRRKREILYNSMHDQLMKNDEDADAALEEGAHQDGFAKIRVTINETDPYDKSNSELWSSFSSSEERLLNCEGLLVNLPLKSHEMCNENAGRNLHHNDFLNSISYRVTSNGYYFFVFNSENEVKPNFLRVHFRLEKTKYDVTESLASCQNQTEQCNLPLSFWSEEKVVLQVPVMPNDSLWNQEYLAVSTCEPRTTIYMICVISVPLFIMLFAFQ